MTKIVFTKDDKAKTLTLTAEGHAGYAEEGKDIVCSAVSILLYTYSDVIEGLKKSGDIARIIDMRLEKGNAAVSVRAKNYKAFADAIKYLFACLKGFDLLSKSYPDHVSFIMTDIRR